VGALKALSQSPICPSVQLIRVDPPKKFREDYPAVAKLVVAVPTLIFVASLDKIEGFEVVNWIVEETNRQGGPIAKAENMGPEIEGIFSGENKSGIASDSYSFLPPVTEIKDNLAQTNNGMHIIHSYATISAAYSGQPNAPGGDIIRGTSNQPPMIPSGNRTAKEREMDKRISDLQNARNNDPGIPKPVNRLGSMPQQQQQYGRNY